MTAGPPAMGGHTRTGAPITGLTHRDAWQVNVGEKEVPPFDISDEAQPRLETRCC